MANYVVELKCLEKYLPRGTKVDQFEGMAFVSLVAFTFDKSRVVGMPIPGHRRFEEVNLRFYVVHENSPAVRAVTFISEIVPKKAIAFVANRLFSERYRSMPMSSAINENKVCYSWGNELENRFEGQVADRLKLPDANSVEEFITEHYVGYSRSENGALEYRVEHPQWECCLCESFDISVNFGNIYGEDFRFLGESEPYNVLYTEGSRVTATFPRRV